MQLRELNRNMYNAAVHLAEAGKYLMAISPDMGMALLKAADTILEEIKLEEEKVPKEKLESIMEEIMNIKVGGK